MLPNFIIVGAPKAGTTSLYHYLSEHPQVFMSEPKEVNFFSKEEIESQDLYYKDFKALDFKSYKKLFNKAEGKIAIGEGSVSYLFYPKTPEKIKDSIPNVKIIILLRNPLDRGYSHYLMDYRLGLVDLTYDEIVFRKTKHKKLDLYYQQYVELGLYFEQVKRYLKVFGKKQVKIYLQEDMRDNSNKIINDLYDYLGLEKDFMPDTSQKHNSFSIPKYDWIQKLYSSYAVRTTLSILFPKSIKYFLLRKFFETSKKPELNFYITLFGKENVLIIDYDDYAKNNIECLEGIVSFVGLPIIEFQDVRANTFKSPKAGVRWIYSSYFARKTYGFIVPNVIRKFIRKFIYDTEKPDTKFDKNSSDMVMVKDDFKKILELISRAGENKNCNRKEGE